MAVHPFRQRLLLAPLPCLLFGLFPWLQFVDDGTLVFNSGVVVASIADAEGGGMTRGKAKGSAKGANLGFDAQLWSMSDSLRPGMDSAEYKHVVLGLIFLKYVSDRFH
jgi:hypothetical protein